MRSKLRLAAEKNYPVFKFTGSHILGELHGIPAEILNSVDCLEQAIMMGIDKASANCHGIQMKRFNPHGVTLLALLSESHVAVHTYPEYESLFLDAFTCGNTCNPRTIVDTIIQSLNPKKVTVKEIPRGEEAIESQHQ